MKDILKEITAHKRSEVAARRVRRPLATVREAATAAGAGRGFRAALETATVPAVIAELKKASPSAGTLREAFDPAAIARSYAAAGAAGLSVLTDERYFQGSDCHLREARQACDLPLLRKDFVVDAYQLHEARALGADCVLLIVAALDAAQLKDFAALATELGLDALIEVHDRRELDMALETSPRLLGINNRDLGTFRTSIDTTLALLPAVPAGVTVVSESGIAEPQDVARLTEAGVKAFLVGTAFMRAADPGAALRGLFADAWRRS